MKRAWKKKMAWVLAIMVLMGCIGAFAQEDETAGGEGRTEVIEPEKESPKEDKQPKEQLMEEKPVTEKHDKSDTDTPSQEGSEPKKPEDALAGADESVDVEHQNAEPEQEEPGETESEEIAPDEAIQEETLPEEAKPEALQPEEEQTDIESSIVIRRIMPKVIRRGEPFQLKATVVGIEGRAVDAQWQYLDGNEWTDVEDEMVKKTDGLTLEVYADADNVNYDWRILVSRI